MDALVFAALLATPFINWPVAIILIRLARIRPTIRALTERAILAVIIAIVTTVYWFIAINTQLGFPVITPTGSMFIIRCTIVTIGLYPLWWLWSYSTGRFKGTKQDAADEEAKDDLPMPPSM